jgi:O-succinylhomoserine sulfhydrylase
VHTPEKKEEIGISDGLVRISAGLENTDDLIDGIQSALN